MPRPFSLTRLSSAVFQRPQFSHSAPLKELPATRIFISNSRDPYFNLSFEDWLFRSSHPESYVLLFYRNAPSVIIGRNQNIWKELNIKELNARSIPFVRRRSGGGTVYHDLGNTNFSIAMPRPVFDRRTYAELVARALRNGLNIKDASVNDRNDIIVEGKFKMSIFLSPRSAYKIVNKRAYHHGTMLIDAKLHDLGVLLRNDKTTMITKGVDSVRSPVRNIKEYNPLASHEGFVESVSHEFEKAHGTGKSVERIDIGDTFRDPKGVIQKGMDELKGWEWAYGQTPEFTHDLKTSFSWGDIVVRIHSKHGIINACDLKVDQESATGIDTRTHGILKSLADGLVGSRYGEFDVSIADKSPERLRITDDVINWLREMQ